MTQDKQEPKNPYPSVVVNSTHSLKERDHRVWQEGADAMKPLLAALQQRVKELQEEIEYLKDKESFHANFSDEVIESLKSKITALESQLKPVSELTDRQIFIWWTGIDNPIISDDAIKQDLDTDEGKRIKRIAELTWRKALASQKGETK